MFQLLQFFVFFLTNLGNQQENENQQTTDESQKHRVQFREEISKADIEFTLTFFFEASFVLQLREIDLLFLSNAQKFKSVFHKFGWNHFESRKFVDGLHEKLV